MGETILDRARATGELWFRVPMWLVFLVGVVLIHALAPGETQWHLMFYYSAVLILSTALSNSPLTFFTGQGATLTQTLNYLARGTPLPRPEMPDATVEERRRAEVGFWTLMPSAFITCAPHARALCIARIAPPPSPRTPFSRSMSHTSLCCVRCAGIFAKSINNSALYGTRWGVMGGVVYAGWYASFPAAAVFGYVLRTRHGYGSLPTAIERCYGSSATILFGLIVLYRLWNEIWSNTVVVAAFYSEQEKTAQWWLACVLSAAVPAVFVLMGGMRSSLITDVLMAFLGLLFLFVILGYIGASMPGGIAAVWSWQPDAGWWPGAGTALGASLLQGCVSYPFHDAVLTDRAFLSRPRTMLASFLVGGSIAAMFIVLYSAIGIYGVFALDESNFYASAPVARSLGPTAFAFINLVMMTSSMSTIDSAYGSVSKLVGLEFAGWFPLPFDDRAVKGPLRPTDAAHVGWAHVLAARVSIVLLAIAGTLYVLVDTSTINATEVSGTMVMGLGPPIWLLLAWKHNSAPGSNDGWHKAPLMFVLPYAVGLFFGVVYNTAAVGTPAEKARAGAMMAPFQMGVGKRTRSGRHPQPQPEPGVPTCRPASAHPPPPRPRLPRAGSFRTFLGWNVLGHCLCLAACLLGFVIHQTVWKLGTVDPPPSVEHPSSGERIVRAGFEGVHDDAQMVGAAATKTLKVVA